jgi:hypothetical protein
MTTTTEQLEANKKLALMLGGHMFCGVVKDTLMVRLSPTAPSALDRPHVRPMDFTGRPMTWHPSRRPGARPTCRSARRLLHVPGARNSRYIAGIRWRPLTVPAVNLDTP